MRILAAFSICCLWSFAFLNAMAAEMTLSAPENVPAGSDFSVSFSGVDESGDLIGVLVPGSGAYTRDGYAYAGGSAGVVELTAPLDPGSYEIVYRRRAETIAKTEIEITEVSVSLLGPDSVAAGTEFEISWHGPANARDAIRISHRDGTRVSNISDVQVASNSDSTLTLTAPETPGDYTVGYVVGGETLASMILHVIPAQENLSAL